MFSNNFNTHLLYKSQDLEKKREIKAPGTSRTSLPFEMHPLITSKTPLFNILYKILHML